MSLPVRGAWVEIYYIADGYKLHCGRSPCGERGLKSQCAVSCAQCPVSLPVRGAWVEITKS